MAFAPAIFVGMVGVDPDVQDLRLAFAELLEVVGGELGAVVRDDVLDGGREGPLGLVLD